MKSINDVQNKIVFPNVANLLNSIKFSCIKLYQNSEHIFSVYKVFTYNNSSRIHYVYIGNNNNNSLIFIPYITEQPDFRKGGYLNNFYMLSVNNFDPWMYKESNGYEINSYEALEYSYDIDEFNQFKINNKFKLTDLKLVRFCTGKEFENILSRKSV